jgi:hypothetical protein
MAASVSRVEAKKALTRETGLQSSIVDQVLYDVDDESACTARHVSRVLLFGAQWDVCNYLKVVSLSPIQSFACCSEHVGLALAS